MALKELHIGAEHYLYDAELFGDFTPALFTVARGGGENTLGRGNALMFEFEDRWLIKRHYLRGGWIRHLVHDTYAFHGLAHTRMWREADITHTLYERGLPVARFVAARCAVHARFRYSGDIITQLIPGTETLAQRLQSGPMPEARWHKVGATIARFHAEGVCHADLNANNVLLAGDGSVYLIDFDKAVFLRRSRKWQQANLARLLRSLHKQQRLHPELHFSDQNWLWLLNAYAGTTR